MARGTRQDEEHEVSVHAMANGDNPLCQGAVSGFVHEALTQEMKGRDSHATNGHHQANTNGASKVNGLCTTSERKNETEQFEEDDRRRGWSIRPSEICLGIQNPIRKLTDELHASAAAAASRQVEGGAAACGQLKKEVISLGQGDPTAFGHLKTADVAAQAVAEAALSGRFNGYAPSTGLMDTRRAIAKFSTFDLATPVQPENVFVTSGTGQSLQLCFEVLTNPGSSNILLPRPGFPVYECFCQSLQVEIRHYDLLPENNWEVDCGQLESLVDKNTAAILVCNPGNPSGAVFSEAHLREIVATALRLRVPIIADEVYGGIVFSGQTFTPLASVAGSVPVLTVSSLSKRFLVPGWRLGWITIHDSAKILRDSRVIDAFHRLLQFSPSPCSLMQAAAPKILFSTPPSFLETIISTTEAAATLSAQRAEEIVGLSCPSRPQGSMFIMVKIDLPRFPLLTSDESWCAALFQQQSVLLIPGTAFGIRGWARLAITVPLPLLHDAWDRIEEFCCENATKFTCEKA